MIGAVEFRHATISKQSSQISLYYRIPSLAGRTSGAASWNFCTTLSPVQLLRTSKRSSTKTVSLVAMFMSSRPCGAGVRFSMSSLVRGARRLCSFTLLEVIVVNIMGLSLRIDCWRRMEYLLTAKQRHEQSSSSSETPHDGLRSPCPWTFVPCMSSATNQKNPSLTYKHPLTNPPPVRNLQPRQSHQQRIRLRRLHRGYGEETRAQKPHHLRRLNGRPNLPRLCHSRRRSGLHWYHSAAGE